MIRRGLVVLTIIAIRTSDASKPLALGAKDIPSCQILGEAEVTYYGGDFHGRPMANGEVFNKEDPTIVASPILAMGRRVRITHIANRKSIEVVVQDRMPEDAPLNALDVSEAAARMLGIETVGRARLFVEAY